MGSCGDISGVCIVRSVVRSKGSCGDISGVCIVRSVVRSRGCCGDIGDVCVAGRGCGGFCEHISVHTHWAGGNDCSWEERRERYKLEKRSQLSDATVLDRVRRGRSGDSTDLNRSVNISIKVP